MAEAVLAAADTVPFSTLQGQLDSFEELKAAQSSLARNFVFPLSGVAWCFGSFGGQLRSVHGPTEGGDLNADGVPIAAHSVREPWWARVFV